MKVWPAFLAPLLALLDQGVAYAMVDWACGTQNPNTLNWVHFIFLALAITFTLPAWHEARMLASALPSDEGDAGGRPRMIAMVAAMTGALSSLTILALWAPHWFLSPCFN